MKRAPYLKFAFTIIHAVLMQYSVAFPQKKSQIENAETFKLSYLTDVSSSISPIPFKEIVVKDYRFDTTKIGYVIPVKLSKIVPEANSSAYFTKTLNECFQKNLDTGSGNSLVIILKTFWLQKGDIEDMSDKNIETKFTLTTGDEGVCFAEFETFSLKDGNYRALTKLDHIFLTSAYRSRKIKDFILQPFDSLIKKIATINIETHLSKKRNISWNEIHSAYSKRFDLPVLTQHGSQKGVFLTFNDFENNITTHPDFIFKQSKLS